MSWSIGIRIVAGFMVPWEPLFVKCHGGSPDTGTGEDEFSFKEVILLAIATSIDAFAVGITIALLKDPILISAAIIGVVAFAFSIAGIYIGKRIGVYVGDKFQILGGVILILIGIKILLGF